MKKFVIINLLILFSISCADRNIKITDETDPLKIFFNLSISDITKAKKVIADNDLVKNLTHLQSMDNGGKKYYLLERESITKMLKSVTEGLYNDYILLNKPGIVIYTMFRDEYFAKSVKSSLKNSALNRCHANHDIEFYFEDSFLTCERDSEKYIYISSVVKGGNTQPGMLILEIDPVKILEITGARSRILNLKGEVIISQDWKEIGKAYSHLDHISLNPVYDKIFSFKADNRRYRYRFFKFLNIEWIIINE